MSKIEKWIHRLVILALALYEAVKTIIEQWPAK